MLRCSGTPVCLCESKLKEDILNILAGAPRTLIDKLQCVLNAAARVVTGTWEFDLGLGQILHDELHWLDFPDWVFLQACGDSPSVSAHHRTCRTTVSRSPVLTSTAYSTALPAQHLQMSGLSVADSTVWNSLSNFIWDLAISADCFRPLLKTFFSLDIVHSAGFRMHGQIYDSRRLLQSHNKK